MDQPGFPKPEQTVSVALTTDMEVSKAPATYLGGKGRAETVFELRSYTELAVGGNRSTQHSVRRRRNGRNR